MERNGGTEVVGFVCKGGERESRKEDLGMCIGIGIRILLEWANFKYISSCVWLDG